MINFHTAEFEISAAKRSQCPPAEVPEIVFAGRSNAGKSTAINTLCQQRQLAYASKMPGRTQLLNFFRVRQGQDAVARLVDLPGYGFAQIALSQQSDWDKELGGYLQERRCLAGVVMIVDCRRGLLPMDIALIDWVAPRQLPVHVVLSKADKLNRQDQVKILRDTQALLTQKQQAINEASLHPTAATFYSLQLWSSIKKIGFEDLQQQLSAWIESAK